MRITPQMDVFRQPPRRLRRGAVNLLGGRARTLKMYPLTAAELKNDFNLKLLKGQAGWVFWLKLRLNYRNIGYGNLDYSNIWFD